MGTVHSDWGYWLVREVETTEPERFTAWYLGCNGFVLKAADGTTLFIDPYCGTGDPPRTVRMVPVPFDPAAVSDVDAVLATHEHTDHVHGPTQAPLVAAGAEYYAPDDSLAVVREENWRAEYDLPEAFREVSEGDSLSIGGVTVHVEPAHDPDASHPVAYAVEYDGATFFHAGDARPSEAFADVGARREIDLGAVAFGSVGRLPDKRTREPTRTRWYNDENDVIEVATQLRLERLVPTHWDMWKGLTADPSALADHRRSFEFPRRLAVAEIGDSLAVGDGAGAGRFAV
jgi:L-ascorbate 6-phosphate lactonase